MSSDCAASPAKSRTAATVASTRPIERQARTLPQGSLQARPCEGFVVRIERLGDAVGVEVERVARGEPDRRGFVLPIGAEPEDEALRAGDRGRAIGVDQIRRLMARATELQFAGPGIQHAEEHR